jgi:hypothetical protein
MFDYSNTAFLPENEFFLAGTSIKKCRKLSFRKKHYERHIEQACLKQNTIRQELKKILPESIRQIEDTKYGIDYLYKGTTIDQKFSFGALGENTIKIRVKNRRLLNNSDWTMIINKNNEIELFETHKLAAFVKKNWGIIQKRLIGKKEEYSEYAVSLPELYALESIAPITAGIKKEELERALISATQQKNIHTIEQTLNENKTILDDNKMLCFEPAIATIALQLFEVKVK